MTIEVLSRNDISMLEEKVDRILTLLKGKVNSDNTEWLRTSDVKKMLNISDATLKNYRDKGVLGFSKIGGTYYYSIKNIMEAFTVSFNKTA